MAANDYIRRIVTEVSLLDFCRVADISNKDFDKLYKTISSINENTFESETAMKIASDYELDKIENKEALQERLNIIKANIAKKSLSEGENTQGENINFMKSFLLELGVNKNEAPILADAIVNDKLSQPFDCKKTFGDRLFGVLLANQNKITDKLKDDFQKYSDTKTTNPVVKNILPSIEGYLDTKNKNISFEFAAREKDCQFRKNLRADFNSDDGVKKRFFKLYGTMMEHGKNLTKGTASTSGLSSFCKIMQDNFGEDYLTEVDQALGISPKKDEDANKLRQDAYDTKCKEVYLKTTLAILNEKRKSDLTQNSDNVDYNAYVESNINNNYIKNLMRGNNDMGALCFVQPSDEQALSPAEERKLNREMRDETAERQVISLHHKLPIGAISDLYNKMFKTEKESEKFEKCCKMIHLFSNMCTVIGKEKHQSMEPYGAYELKPSQDCLIFASRINSDKLEFNRLKIPPYLKEGLKKHTQQKGTFDIGVSMKFSEPKEFAEMRKILNQEKPKESLLGRCIRYFEKSNA